MLDTNGDQIQVTYDEQGRINRRLADNETVDDLGFVWEYKDNKPDLPINRLDRNAPTPEDNAEHDRRIFRETFANIQDEQLPLTPEGMVERRQRSLFEAARLEGLWPDQKKIVVEPVSGADPDHKSLVESYYESRNKLVPTTTTVPQIKTKEVNDNPQDSVVKDIERRYAEDKQKVQNDPNGYHTTSQDYFIEQDGKVIRASRVHNVKPEAYKHEDEKKIQDNLLDDLKKAKSVDEIRNVLEEYIVPFDDSQVYLRYLKDNWDELQTNPTELNTTLYNLSRVWNNRETSASVLVGNIVDELARNFLGSDVLYNKTLQDGGIEWLFDQVNESDGRTYRELYRNNFDSFASLIRQLQGQYEYYTNTLGWKLSTLPFTVRSEFKDLGWVAGQTDVIGVDTNGKVHIIDFKTS
ncbi:MAG: hypothetical protein IJ889_03270 [Eubacterium sp.]|nr:hypothetical protein [Eubacterium sp.]